MVLSMRMTVACLGSLLLLPALNSYAQTRVSSSAEYVIGQVTRVSGKPEIDLGFVHGLKRGDRLALFRESEFAWNPVGILKVTKAGSSTSTAESVRGDRPRRGDLVIIGQALLPSRPSSKRFDHFVQQRVLSRGYQNGYDTSATETDTRQLSRLSRDAQRWFRRGSKTGIRLTFGVRREAYNSRRVVRLAKQCRYVARLGVEFPAVTDSLTEEWQDVLPMLAPLNLVPESAKTDKAEADEDAPAASVKNVLPKVREEFDQQPRAVQEAIATVLAALVAKSPQSYSAFLQSQFLQTQFPQLATDREFLQQLQAFIPKVTGE